jgi:hypothetical protein
MGEISAVAAELRDEVLQTIIAVRLHLGHAAAYNDPEGMRRQAADAQEYLGAEARRLRELIDRLTALADELEPEAPAPRLRLLP